MDVRRWLFWLSCLALACGGSSSETPPPLEPDPARLSGAARAEVPAAEAAPERSEPDPAPVEIPALEGRGSDLAPSAGGTSFPEPGAPAVQTWGAPASKQKSKPAPEPQR